MARTDAIKEKAKVHDSAEYFMKIEQINKQYAQGQIDKLEYEKMVENCFAEQLATRVK